MITDENLIENIVAWGGILRANPMSWHLLDSEGDMIAVFTSEKEALNSWQLAGRLMELCFFIGCFKADGEWKCRAVADTSSEGQTPPQEDKIFTRAIILACMAALEGA